MAATKRNRRRNWWGVQSIAAFVALVATLVVVVLFGVALAGDNDGSGTNVTTGVVTNYTAPADYARQQNLDTPVIHTASSVSLEGTCKFEANVRRGSSTVLVAAWSGGGAICSADVLVDNGNGWIYKDRFNDQESFKVSESLQAVAFRFCQQGASYCHEYVLSEDYERPTVTPTDGG